MDRCQGWAHIPFITKSQNVEEKNSPTRFTPAISAPTQGELMQAQSRTPLPIPSGRLGLEKRYRGVFLGPPPTTYPSFFFFPRG